MKKILSLGTLALAGVLAFTGCGKDEGMTKEEALKYAEDQGYVKPAAPEQLEALPAPRLTEDGCNSDTYGNGCAAINKNNLYNYLGRSDVTYIDLRDFNDYQFSHLEGFEMVQFFSDIWDQTGTGGTQLFNQDYTPRYKDSVEILKTLIPQDKTVFLMCAGGGRVVYMMDILELNGWDMSKIYNVGGMNQYTADEYEPYIVSNSKTTLTFKTGTDTDTSGGHTYTTRAYVSVDANNKITNVYVQGTEYTAGTTAEWNQDTWLNGKYEYCQSLVGKTLADIQTMLGTDGAEGDDVVTGATLSSNRVLRAVVNALTPAA